MKGKQKTNNIYMRQYSYSSLQFSVEIGLGNKDDLEQNKLNQVSTIQLKSVWIVW